MMFRALALIPFVLGMILMTPVIARPQQKVSDEELRGLSGIRVEVVPLGQGQDVLPLSTLQTDMELKLRLARLPILTTEWTPTQDGKFEYTPTLQLNIVTQQSGGLYAFCVQLRLREEVGLKRLLLKPGTVYLTYTWARANLGTVGSAHMPTTIRAVVRDMVDEFINAYLAANPKR